MVFSFTGDGGGVGGATAIQIDSPIASSLTSKLQDAFGFERLVSGYSGNVCRLIRTSDSAEMDFGLTSIGALDIDAISTWVGTSTATLKSLYSQASTGKVLDFSTSAPVFFSNGKVNTRFGVSQKNYQGDLLRIDEGACGIDLSGGYGELLSHGLTVADGLEVHTLLSPVARKRIGTADAKGSNATNEVLWALWQGTWGSVPRNWWYSQWCSGTSLRSERRFTDTPSSNETIATTNSTPTLSQPNTTRISINSTQIQTVGFIPFGGTVAAGRQFRYENGVYTSDVDSSTQDATRDDALADGNFRIGQRGDGGNDAKIVFGAVIFTDTLTNNERYFLQQRLQQVSQYHRRKNITDIFNDYFDELMDARNINASTGLWTGEKGKLTVQFATTVSNPSSDWNFAYTIPDSGLVGIYNTGDGTNDNNTFDETSSYFTDVGERGVSSLLFCYKTANEISPFFGVQEGTAGTMTSLSDAYLELGDDHFSHRARYAVDPAVDTQGWSSEQYQETGDPDLGLGGFSQALGKYSDKNVNDYKEYTTTVAMTLDTLYGGASYSSGEAINRSWIWDEIGLRPPTPEHDFYGSDFNITLPTNSLRFLIATNEPDPTWDFASSSRKIKRATGRLYFSCGSLIGHTDASIGVFKGTTNHCLPSSTAKLRTLKHQGKSHAGVSIFWGFLKGVLTPTQVEEINVNFYKFLTEDYNP